MGMPVTVEISKNSNMKISKYANEDIDEVFDYFRDIDNKYSPFKEMSEVAKLNRGEKVGKEMKMILELSETLRKETDGYFNIMNMDGKIDPSGIVKGWAIKNASDILRKKNYKRFYIDAGGDAEIVGANWKWGIKNPFNSAWHSNLNGSIVKVLNLSNCGIATSGTYERGQHIYNPVTKKAEITDIVSLTVIGQNVYEADRFTTPAFAMGSDGINFIERQTGLEGYMIDKNGIATMTTGFHKYELPR